MYDMGNTSHPYWKRSFLGKAINGFLTYQMCSWLSLITPEKVDFTLYKELTEQFKEFEQYKKEKESK
jgi:hypothetical protein